ncbi:prepilin-type N-terminal cleavage/methylation domain-containing protein [Paucibacter sp. APW11]|uniref:Prepilin-type N-terminal cleavage/methylation domain-containing protein n=1 Tax=Roseateles aquae TaxID=3077235 RepID=A0ABU3P855_9BURK|nr:prepilin-type N-terminal cleavage/methylation domain-containing protein [Paucibacter sp. APW11]MDT8998748.1 prepilin-type N-terminal cleavage/methylation domain-containing protein [Paucibacter sp. APW11]
MARRPSSPPPASSEHRGEGGFTLIELVIVMLLVAALAVFALPRLIDTAMWRLRAFGDDAVSQLQAMQRLALAQRRPITATITASGISIAYSGGTSLAQLDCPSEASPCIAEGGSRSVVFNSGNQGRSLVAGGASITMTVAYGSYSQAYRIENESGLVYPLP